MRKLLRKLRRAILKLGGRAHAPGTTDGLVIALVLGAAWWLAVQRGGARAEALPIAARLMLAAMVMHGASLLLRREDDERVSLLGLAGAPFVAWLALDAALIAPDRGQALGGLVTAMMAAAAWHLILHHARRTWSLVMTLALVIGPAALLACGVFDLDERHLRGLLGAAPNPAYAGHFISALGSPGTCAAVMLMVALPSLALALNTSLRPWKRIAAAYFATLLTLGLAGTHHAWAWVAFAAGVAALLWRLCASNPLRLAVAAGAGLLGWALASEAVVRVGMLRAGDAEGAAWLAKGFARAWLDHPWLGGGAGSFPLSFEAVRPATWQSDPASCGSLPLQLLAEHGLLGGLLLLAPAAWIAWVCLSSALARESARAESAAAAGGRSRAALRESLRRGACLGATGAAFVLALDYPGGVPGILLLVVVLAATAFRMSHRGEARMLPASLSPKLGLACLLAPALITPAVVAPLHSGAVLAQARPVVAQASPTGLTTPSLLAGDNLAALVEAAGQIGSACQLNPLDGEARAWHAQALALLVRQDPQDALLQASARGEAEAAVRLNPRSAWARVVLAGILLGSSDATARTQGEAHLRAAAKLAPMNQAVALRVAQGLGQAGASAAELRAAYERALLTNPTRAEVRDKLMLLRASAPAEPSER